MKRAEFLKSMGITGAALMAVLMSCQKEEVEPGPIPGPVDFDLNLTDPANEALNVPGGYVVAYSVVVARTSKGRLVAVTKTCSHAGQKEIQFKRDEFVCSAHGARFGLDGKGLNPLGDKGLTVYKTKQTGPIVRVYS